MAQADWTELTGSLSGAVVDRGVTTGVARASGGGSFLYGMNSLDTSVGAVGLFANLTNFAPLAKGGSIRGAIQRGIGGGPLGFAPLLFIGLQGTTVNDVGYLLGLEDADPHHIVLRKGALSGGLPNVAIASPPNQGVLRKSSVGYSAGTWLQLRLDMVVNLNGDVVLNCFQNDIAANGIASPIWTAIPGVDQYIDDTLQVNTGSAPYTSGRAGWGGTTKDVTRRMFFDEIEVFRQL